MDLSPGQVGLERQRFAVHRMETQGVWSYPEHSHRGFTELFYLARGTLDHAVNARRDRLSAGSLVLVREGDRHSLSARDLLYFNLNLHPADLARAVAYLDEGPQLAVALAAAEAPPPASIAPAERHGWEAALNRLFEQQSSPGADPLLQRILVDLLGAFARAGATPPAAAPPAWLSQALAESGESLPSLTPGGLARRAGVSPAHLARSMRRHFGTTPSAWLNRCRLERAALRLTRTNEPIAAICFSLGFSHLGWFYRVFRRAYGCPPAAYRRRHGVA